MRRHRARRLAGGAALLLAGLALGCDDGPGYPAAAVSASAVASDEASPGGRPIDPPAAAGSLAPNLARVGGDVVLSWLEPASGGGHRLLVSRFDGAGWTAPSRVAESDRFFANWADLPAVAASGDGSLVAHWLAKTGAATYAYSIFVARSVDGGATWAGLGRLNDDETPTEHGFVSYALDGAGLRAFWLDGRAMYEGGDMALRTALIGEAIGPSEMVDPRVCECCATDAARAGAGPVVVYRDRIGDEIRDISLVRRGGGGWARPSVVAEDGWRIAGCPVNGPAIDVADEAAVVAWFTAAGDAPRVRLAFSTDGGATFGSALAIDDEAPPGRVDIVLDGAGGAVVSWLALDGDRGSVRLRQVTAEGAMGEPLAIATTGAERASGFPRLARVDDTLYLAWVDTTPADGQRLRARAVPLAAVPAPE